VETRGRRAGQGAQAVPPAGARPHPAALPRAAARAPARTGVQTPARTDALASARTDAGALRRTAEPVRPRTGALALLRTDAQGLLKTGTLVTARTGVRVLPRIAVPVPPIAVPAVRVPVRPPTAGERHRRAGVVLLRRARVHSAGPQGVPPTGDPERTVGRLESAAARPRARVRSHGGQADPGQAVPAEVFARPAAPARTASPAGRPGPRPGTGLGGPQRAETRVAIPGPGAARAGPPMVTVYVAGEQPLPGTADPRLAAEPAVLASLVRRGPPTVATGAQVLRGHARMARVGTTQTGARRGRAVSDPVPAARRIGRPEIEATPPGGRHVTGRQDQRATEAATEPRCRLAAATATVTGLRGRPAAATATEAATVTAPAVATEAGATSAAGAAAGSAQAADDLGAVKAPGVATAPRAASAPGPAGTRVRPGHPA
jgi:hypothetical protein